VAKAIFAYVIAFIRIYYVIINCFEKSNQPSRLLSQRQQQETKAPSYNPFLAAVGLEVLGVGADVVGVTVGFCVCPFFVGLRVLRLGGSDGLGVGETGCFVGL